MLPFASCPRVPSITVKSLRVPVFPIARHASLRRLALGFGLLSYACVGQRFDQVADDELSTTEDRASAPGDGDASSNEPTTSTPANDDTTGSDSSDDTEANDPRPSDTEAPGATTPDSDLEPDDSNDPVEAGVPDMGDSESPGSTPTDPEIAPTDSDGPAPEETDTCAAGEECAGPTENTETDLLPSEPDECPDVPEQILRGLCGCGFAPDETCAILEAGIKHRYSFFSKGTAVEDVVGGAHGTLVGTQLDGSGILELDGATTHVQLPSGIISALTSATFEAWLRWDGGGASQRIFNFGTPSSSDGAPSSFISVSPNSSSSDNMNVSYRADRRRSAETLRSNSVLPTGSLQHVAVVVDGANDRLSLYLQGELIAIDETDHDLTQLEDSVNWLARPLYSGYPYLRGALHEFRIYDVALTSDELKKSYELGPGATFSAQPLTR